MAIRLSCRRCPGVVLALFLWRLREPERGAMDGIATPPDPRPFRASLALLGTVTPGLHWLAMLRRRASLRGMAINLAALIVIAGGMVMLARIGMAQSPRPALDFGMVAIDPHVLQWLVIGLGLFVLVNLLQGVQVSDPQAFHVIAGSPTLIMAMAVGTLQSAINYGMMAFNPSFLMRTYHLSMADTALQFGLLSAATGIAGPLVWGVLSDRLHLRFPAGGRAMVALVSMGLSPLLSFWVYTAPLPGDFYLRFVLYSLC
jgi:hypothetical protein